MRWSTYKKALIHKIDSEQRTTDHGISYNVFTNIPPLAKLNKENLFSRVWIVDYPRTTKVKFVGITEDGIEVKFQGEIPVRTLYEEEVMLHPSEWEDDRETNRKKK